MTVDAIIPALFWILVAALLAYFGLRALHRRYPNTSFSPFRSRQDLGRYFAFAGEILGADKRLIRYPIYLAVLNYLVYLPWWLHVRGAVFKSFEHSPIPVPLRLPVLPITLSGVVRALLETPRMLSYGFFGFLTGSVVVIVLSVVAALFFRRLTERLRSRIGDADPEGLVFLDRSLRTLRQALLATGIPLIAALVLGLPCFVFAFSLAVSAASSIAALLIASLIEGIILLYVSDHIIGDGSERGGLVERSLSVLKPLFKLNIVIVLGLTLGELIAFPFNLRIEIYSLFGIQTPYSPSFPFWLAVRVTRYFSPVFAALTVFAPFFLVTQVPDVKGALSKNFTFAARHFLKYVTMIAASVFLLYIPRLLKTLLAGLVPALSVPDFVIKFLLAILGIALAVRVFPALFKFFHEYSRVDRKPPIPRSQGQV